MLLRVVFSSKHHPMVPSQQPQPTEDIMQAMQTCALPVYWAVDLIAGLVWYLTMGGTVILFFLSWIGFSWQKQKLQLVLPGIEESAETFGYEMSEWAFVWFWTGCVTMGVMSLTWFGHALLCLL